MKVHETVKLLPGSHVIRNVEIGENSSVWFNAVLRGDRGGIKIGKNVNIQDNSVIHSSPNSITELKDNVSIGHGAIIHGCNVDENVLIGMNATILNGAKIAKNSIVGAGALVTENKEFSEGSLIIGFPAKAVRKLTEEEIEGIKLNAMHYVKLAQEY
ncbi:gamma carbonic anhydrase family protein [Methanobrevibacter filiformis]|uniref:2,3,4,5-tetrahydropyridine-2,6-dicarboxylate N-acetyltransferase n=1 Tax=Methanobrevibacter filiformis TaxID=55758 RepID=A0A166CQ40_9EURY|nr:gamma carbonic anhydrase family protein [Methanobrevibacter filiformis]KZX14751.1 2,3,4,5-tetrahydropyridine-2,6-dicarboxylate N-acetyltransferase [Methanobrevibacter filiformis]